MTIDTRAAMSRVSAYLRASIDLQGPGVRLDPFTVRFDRDSAEPYRNYAVPDDGAEPDTAAIAALVALFETRGCLPRLEYLPELAPAVLPRLRAAGFGDGQAMPLMTCSSSTLAPTPAIAGVEWLMATSAPELVTAARVQNQAYGMAETTDADVDRLRRTVEAGGAVALARDVATGEGLGSGLYAAPVEGVSEIAAVGVAEAARRRGIGGGVTAWLAHDALARGIGFPFLMAAEANEARIYGRIGFARFATMLHIAR